MPLEANSAYFGVVLVTNSGLGNSDSDLRNTKSVAQYQFI